MNVVPQTKLIEGDKKQRDVDYVRCYLVLPGMVCTTVVRSSQDELRARLFNFQRMFRGSFAKIDRQDQSRVLYLVYYSRYDMVHNQEGQTLTDGWTDGWADHH